MENLKELSQFPLFFGIKEEELAVLLHCLGTKVHDYQKNTKILFDGEKSPLISIVLSGRVHILVEDVMGKTALLAAFEEGNLFSEVFVCAQMENCPMSAMAVTECRILSIDYHRAVTTCASACRFHSLMIENLLHSITTKCCELYQKIEFLSKRTIREKLLSYLSYEAQKAGSNPFTISYNREEMASFLCIDRSALSKELGKMRDEHILHFYKNRFEWILS